ncbi:nucleoside-diphosphate kinase [Thermanaerosceptrum fracticalcis]|uniref:Nucleoside diphosphate kinase n=1 Tax=Thermanaerosceptrum fracticalcis TaxID=1712410 RepID=A0A7G6E5P0_THEFR|nr:nucleoside-diphosphate kinase [Thermanaerosceptrum fracticalcis]QNB47394.1 nucleoside-diphosphate kinase [Thermanaerosceptrum fracticalcis]
MERTFVMVKPDGVQRGLIAEIIGRLEKKGYKLIGLKMLTLTPETAALHYAEHAGKPFYPGLISFITSGPVVAMVWEGKNAVKGVRTLMGITNPTEAIPGSIRGDYGIDMGRNVVHGSDSPVSAQREIAIYFKEEELVDYQRDMDKWIYE